MKKVISRKQFSYLTDLAANYERERTFDSETILLQYQEKIGWPWKATKEQGKEWDKLHQIWIKNELSEA